MELIELVKNSRITRPMNLKPKNNVLGSWNEIFNNELQKEKQKEQLRNI